jgi:GxxExxY protein
MDLVVDGQLIVEVKAVERLLPIHSAQMLTYLKLSGYKIGLLMNFNTLQLKDGLRRFVL